MTDWLKAAKRAKTEASHAKFLRRHAEEYLRDTITSCRACPLHKTRKHAVPFDGSPPKPIAIVGEAPGAAEDKEGVPFVGRSGSMLRQMLEASGYERSQAVIMNVVACRPPKNRTPHVEEVEACSPHFDAQLELSGAWVVLLLGQSALSRIRPGVQIGHMRGKPFWQDGRIWIPTYHPAYVLRNRNSRGLVEHDIGLAFDIAYGRKWEEPFAIAPLSKTSDKTLAYSLQHQGYAVVDSKRLGDTVLIVKNGTIVPPAKHGHLVRYTVEELVRIGELGGGATMTTETLQRIHEVKRLGGTVIQ